MYTYSIVLHWLITQTYRTIDLASHTDLPHSKPSLSGSTLIYLHFLSLSLLLMSLTPIYRTSLIQQPPSDIQCRRTTCWCSALNRIPSNQNPSSFWTSMALTSTSNTRLVCRTGKVQSRSVSRSHRSAQSHCPTLSSICSTGQWRLLQAAITQAAVSALTAGRQTSGVT